MPSLVLEEGEYDSEQRVIQLQNGTTVILKDSKSVSLEDDFASLPIIDLSDMYSIDIEKRRAIAENLFHACSKVGFFYAKNHGIPKEVTDEAFESAKGFFHDLTEEEKLKVHTDLLPASQYSGYHPFGKFNRGTKRKYKDLSEAFNWTYEREYDPQQPPPSDDYVKFDNLWPEGMPKFKSNMMRYHSECLKVSRALVRVLALSLGLSENYFDSAVTYPAASARILHYPAQDLGENEQNGVGPHTDFEIFTLVNPGKISGLQVLNKSGQWVKAPPIDDCLIVNVADCLMRLTNDKFVSTVHRVVNDSGEKRYSIPFFFGFNPGYVLDPLPTCYDENNPPKYPVATVKEYLIWRSNMSKGLGVELKTLSAA